MSRIGPLEPRPFVALPRFSVDQLLWVANTRHGPGGHWFARVREDSADHDHLAMADDAKDYLERHRVPLPSGSPAAADMDDLRVIREMIRRLVDPSAPAWTPEAGRLLEAARFSVDPDGAIRAAAADEWAGFVRDLLLPLVQLVDLRDALRICGNPHCRLVFLDLSKNRSRRWCDTRGCGNRDRVSRYRASSNGGGGRGTSAADASTSA